MKQKIVRSLTVLAGILTVVIVLASPVGGFVSQVLAQTNGDAGGFVPCGNTVSDPCTIGHLFKGFIVIVNYLIVMAGFVAVAAIVYAGLKMVASQGDDGGGLKDAKGRMSGAVVGLIIVAVAYVLINALFSGSLSVGVCNGGQILSDPKAYILGTGDCDS